MKFWEALKALDEGQRVEFKSKTRDWDVAIDFEKTPVSRWSTLSDDYYDFRLKPKPREFWINIYPISVAHVLYSSKEDADRAALNDRVGCIKLREVIE